MKTILVVVYMLAAGTNPLWAQEAGDFGAGVVLGSPTGVAAKLWLNGSRALDAGVGLNGDISLYSDYLWHSWGVLPQPSEGRLPVYLGLGAQIGDSSRHGGLGLRAVAGVAYWMPHNPTEIFLEFVPIFRLAHGDGANLNISVGLRYYF